jgi:hypothetical protein
MQGTQRYEKYLNFGGRTLRDIQRGRLSRGREDNINTLSQLSSSSTSK